MAREPGIKGYATRARALALDSGLARQRERPGMTAEEICYDHHDLRPSVRRLALGPLLQRDTTPVGDLPLYRVLLINDANYPWVLLVHDGTRRSKSSTSDMSTGALMIEVSHAFVHSRR